MAFYKRQRIVRRAATGTSSRRTSPQALRFNVRGGRGGLLVGTALATGLLALTYGPNAALAACSNVGGNALTCTGTDTDGGSRTVSGPLTINIGSAGAGNQASVTNGAGDALFGRSVFGNVTINSENANNFVSGSVNGLHVQAGGTVSGADVLGTFNGGTNGIFIDGANAVNFTLGGTATGVQDGIRIDTNVLSDGNVSLTTNGIVTGTTDAGIDITKLGTSGDVNVTTNAFVSGGTTGIDIFSTVAGNTTTTVTNSAAGTSGGVDGISVNTISTGYPQIIIIPPGGGTAVTNVNVNGITTGTTGTGVTALSTSLGLGAPNVPGSATTTVNINNTVTGGVIGGTNGVIAGATAAVGPANTTVNVNKFVTAGSGVGVTAFTASPNAGTTDVNINAVVTSSGTGGVNASRLGNNGGVYVDTTSAGNIIANSGYGIQATQVGDNGLVHVTTEGTIQSGDTGISAILTGDGGTVEVENKNTIDAGGSGIFAMNTGGDSTATVSEKISADGLFGAAAIAGGTGNATVHVNAAIDPPLIGAAAITIGSGTAWTDVNAPVDAFLIGAVGANIGTGLVDIDIDGAIRSDGIGVLGVKVGDGNTDIDVNAAIGGLSGAATGGDGIHVENLFGDGVVTVDTTANGTINAGDDGISINKFFSGADVNGDAVIVNTNAAITAGEDGIDIDQFAGDGNISVSNNASITAAEDGITVTKILGIGDVTVNANENITAGGDGVFALSAATVGDIFVNQASGTSITAGDDGIQAISAFNLGNVVVNTGAFSSITAGDDGISVVKAAGLGSVYVNTGAFSSITAGDDGIQVTSVLDGAFTSLDVDTGAFSLINAGDDGIEATQALAGGNIEINTGAFSGIIAGDDGINASSYASLGTIDVDTGFGSVILAGNDGIVADKLGGSGDVRVDTGAFSFIGAGDDAITAVNYAVGAGNNINVDTGAFSVAVANDKGVRAGGWDRVVVDTGAFSILRGDADEDGTGNAIKVFDSDVAVVNVGFASAVVGSGKSWGEAVVSIDSDDATFINVGAGSLVTSWSLFSDGLATAASDIVIDTDGGATDIDNFGTIIGRIGLTSESDVFNNNSSNTWITVGDNYYGDGDDLQTNPGRIVTAVQGGLAETTNLFSLETFENGDAGGNGAGLLTMVDDDTLGAFAQRDVTSTSGIFVAHSAGPLGTDGNSTLGVDAWLGGPGTTSDVFVVGGLDEAGNPIAGQTTFGTTEIFVNDVNAGGAGAYNPQGILVVDVQNGETFGKYNGVGEDPNFVIDPNSANYDSKFGGVIDKGLFFYDLVTKPDGNGGTGHYLVGLPDGEAFELPSLITGAQAIWRDTSGVWLDRQADLRSYLLNPVVVGPATTIVTKEQGLVTKAPPMAAPQSITPGVWGKAVGSWSSRDRTSSYSAFGNDYKFDTGYDQDTYGFIAGVDFGKTNGDSAFVIGALGGYVTSKLDFSGSKNSVDYSGGTVGVYATYLNQGFFIDGLFQADFLDMDYNANSLNAGQQSSDVTNLGFTVDAGYRIAWTPTAWFEPVATVSYVNTQIDDLDGIQDTSVNFEDGESLRGAIGARIGGRIYDAATYWVEASATGRYWYEFEGENKVLIENPGDDFAALDNFDGGFGEFTGSLNWFGKGNGWNGFLNGSVLFNDDYTNGSAKVGVRYQW